MVGNTIRIATRRSLLAQWQARFVAAALTVRDGRLRSQLVPLVTSGDRVNDRPVAEVGGKNLFVKELEAAILEDAADIAVHSMKDLPVEQPSGLVIAAVLKRANPADAWVSDRFDRLDELPDDGVVGTSSLRRACQLAHHRPLLRIRPLRGNVDTRLAKLDAGDYDGIILACAGLERLGHAQRIREALPFDLMLPAIAQGAIAIECHRDSTIYERVHALNDEDSERRTLAERAVSLRLGGDCRWPLAAHAVCDGDELRLQAMVGSVDGSKILRATATAESRIPQTVGIHAAEALLAQGAGELLSECDVHGWEQKDD